MLSKYFKKISSILVLLFFVVGVSVIFSGCGIKEEAKSSTYKISQEEKDYLDKKFKELKEINEDTIAYIYAPGTKLDEPVVQTSDNETYLDKTFEGENIPLLGTVFMDTDNKKDYSDKLTFMFGHARGSQTSDNRMFNDVNFYDDKEYFNEHPYLVVETPSRKYYYETAYFLILPETTDLYKTEFKNDEEFKHQLEAVASEAIIKNPNIKINEKDKYLVLSTCREEDPTIRANLYFRQIPDSEMEEFIKKNKDKLVYKKTR